MCGRRDRRAEHSQQDSSGPVRQKTAGLWKEPTVDQSTPESEWEHRCGGVKARAGGIEHGWERTEERGTRFHLVGGVQQRCGEQKGGSEADVFADRPRVPISAA